MLLIIITCKLVVWRLRRIVTSIQRAPDRVHGVLIRMTQHGLYGSLSWINFPIFGYGISPGKQRSPMNEPLRRSVFAGTVCSSPQFVPPPPPTNISNAARGALRLTKILPIVFSCLIPTKQPLILSFPFFK